MLSTTPPSALLAALAADPAATSTACSRWLGIRLAVPWLDLGVRGVATVVTVTWVGLAPPRSGVGRHQAVAALETIPRCVVAPPRHSLD